MDNMIGHNQSPSDAEILNEKLQDKYADILKRADDLAGGYERSPLIVEDDTTAGKLGDFILQIGQFLKNADSTRVAEKEPHLMAGRTVDGFFKALADPLTKAKSALTDRLTNYQRAKAEKERLARLETERLANEAAQKAAAEAAEKEAELALAAATGDHAQVGSLESEVVVAQEAAQIAYADVAMAEKDSNVKPAELSRTRGSLGSVASLRRFWDHKNLDRNTVDLESLRPYFAQADIEKAVKGYIKANHPSPNTPFRQIAGVEIFENTATSVR